jgi:predicted nuclease of predicted toxin-antitoxin system
VNFLVDAQLPPALARWITSQGHHATHVFDLGFHTADDPAIWERARNDQAVIISKDEDFVDYWLLSNQPVAFIWIRKGIVRIAPCWNGLSRFGQTL